MSDCRFVLDNISDLISLKGPLVIGSDAVDVSGAQMVAKTDGWQVLVKTVAPTQQNPRLSVSVALYLDIDGRMENNATVGPRLGADTVYGIVYKNGEWKISKEVLDQRQNAFLSQSTKATYTVNKDGYALNIPYSEVAKDAPAYWKAGVAENDAARLTVDYIPDVGMSCTSSLSPHNGWTGFAAQIKYFLDMGLRDQLVAGAVVIAALLVIFFKRKKAKKKRYDLKT